jgi:hypothetical protein
MTHLVASAKDTYIRDLLDGRMLQRVEITRRKNERRVRGDPTVTRLYGSIGIVRDEGPDATDVEEWGR